MPADLEYYLLDLHSRIGQARTRCAITSDWPPTDAATTPTRPDVEAVCMEVSELLLQASLKLSAARAAWFPRRQPAPAGPPPAPEERTDP